MMAWSRSQPRTRDDTKCKLGRSEILNMNNNEFNSGAILVYVNGRKRENMSFRKMVLLLHPHVDVP